MYWNGEPVVDVWGGLADREAGRPWQRDTAALVFSSTKGVTAALVHLLAQRDQLELDAPVARYWPEFAANGQGTIPVRHVLTHQRGRARGGRRAHARDVFAWEPVCAAIAAQKPIWVARHAHGYHARTFGWILGEVVRRITGATSAAAREEVAGPLGLELWIGLPEEIEPRVATNYTAPEPADPEQRALRAKFMGPDTLLGRVLEGPSDLLPYGPIWNTRALHAAELPSSNGIATARGLARFYAALIGDVDGHPRLLSAPVVAAATAPQVEGPDRVILMPTRFASGFALPPMLSLGRARHRIRSPRRGRLARLRRSRVGSRVRLRDEPDAARHRGRPALRAAAVGGVRVRRARGRLASGSAYGSMITFPDALASRAVSIASSKRASGKRCVIAGERSTSESMRTIWV